MSKEPEGVTYVAYGGNFPYGWGKGATLKEALAVAKSHGGGVKADYTIVRVDAPDSDKIEVEIDFNSFLVYTPLGTQPVTVQVSRKAKK